MFFIRHLAQATQHDLKSIQAIAHITWHATYSEILPEGQTDYMLDQLFDRSHLEKRFEEGSEYFIAEIKHEPVGFSELLPLADDGSIKISKVYILPRYQGKRLGQRLMQTCEVFAQRKGAKKIHLNVNRYNKAYQFYEKLGYKKVKEVDLPFGPYEMNDFLMEKSVG